MRWLELGAIRKKGKLSNKRWRKENDGPANGKEVVQVDEGGTEKRKRSHCKRFKKNVYEFHPETVLRIFQSFQRLVRKIPQKK